MLFVLTLTICCLLSLTDRAVADPNSPSCSWCQSGNLTPNPGYWNSAVYTADFETFTDALTVASEVDLALLGLASASVTVNVNVFAQNLFLVVISPNNNYGIFIEQLTVVLKANIVIKLNVLGLLQVNVDAAVTTVTNAIVAQVITQWPQSQYCLVQQNACYCN